MKAIKRMLRCALSVLSGAGLFLFCSSTSVCAAPGDEHWSREFGWPGSLENVNAIRLHGGKLYYGGGISGGTNATLNVFDGNQVTRLGLFSGSFGTTIYDLMFVGTTLYVGGFFTNVDGVPVRGLARWDGNAWSATGFTNGTVGALASEGANLFVGGLFTNPGGVALTNIGRWDGNDWHPVGSGLGGTNTVLNDAVRALLVTNGMIYAAGNFSNAGTQALSHIAMWDGVSWSSVGEGIRGTTVYSLAWNGSSLIAAGWFTQAGSTPAGNVAQWDGNTWSALGSGLSGPAVSVEVFNDLICVAGNFTSAGGIAITNFAVWDGSNWSSAGSSLSASAFRVYSAGGSLYLGGNFLAAAGGIKAGLARWDGLHWSAIGPPGKLAGLQTTVRALTSDGSNVYAGGAFLYAGQTNATRVGRYDGSRWHSLGTGLNDDVRQLALLGTNLYAAGDFSGGAGGPLALRLARWNGAQWQPLNNTAFNNISSLAVRGNDLFVGGFGGINAVNGTAADVARWDGTNFWSFLRFEENTFAAFPFPGTNVTSIGIQGNNVYLAGNFWLTQCDANLENCIASSNVMRFDGTYARLMGSGLGGPASAIAVIDTNVFFAGSFTIAGSVTVNRIARWDGQSWSQVGGVGVVGSGTISALAVMGTNLYAGGSFTNINNVRASRVAKWDGLSWSPLGSGTAFTATAGPVLALHVVGQDLYVGGTFRTAGAKPSYYLARWNEQTDFDLVPSLELGKLRGTSIGPFKMEVKATGVPSYIIEATVDFLSWTPLLTNTASRYEFFDFSAPSHSLRFYRARGGP
jgi:trimeric autotransporter adhesin